MCPSLKNRNADGLFLTWLKPVASAANDADCVVNANVLWLVTRRKPVLRIDWLNRIIAQGRELESLWVPMRHPSHCITRWHARFESGITGLENAIPTIHSRITAEQRG